MRNKIVGILICTLLSISFFGYIVNVNAQVSNSEKYQIICNTLNNPPLITDVRYSAFPPAAIIVEWVDFENDAVKIGVSWNNDGNVDEWTDFKSSPGHRAIICEGKNGTVGVVAEDEYGAQSLWFAKKSKDITKEYAIVSLCFDRLVKYFPFFEKILNLVL